MDAFDAIETHYQNEQAASRMFREMIEAHGVPAVASIEQIEKTKRGSESWDHYQVLSWKEQRYFATGTAYTVEASHLTITEAQMYEKHLRALGQLVKIN